MKRTLAVLAVSLALAGTSLAGPSIVLNGSFEEGVEIPGLFTTLPAGSTGVTGWTVLPGDIDYISPTLWVASDGVRSLDLTGMVAGGVMQDLATVAGTSYLVEFDMAGNPHGGDAIKSLSVMAGSQSGVFTFDITGKSFADMGWETMQWSFVAESDITTLQFVDLNAGPYYGAALDNVKVTAMTPTAPAPGAVILASLGAGLTGWLRRRRAL